MTDVTLQFTPLGDIHDDVASRARRCLTVVQVFDRLFLRAQIGVIAGEAAIIHGGQHDADPLCGRHRQEVVDAGDQAISVHLPDDEGQVGAQGVVAHLSGPRQLQPDGREIEGLPLPHLRPVDGGSGQVVEPSQPGLLAPPLPGLFCGPLLYRHRPPFC